MMRTYDLTDLRDLAPDAGVPDEATPACLRPQGIDATALETFDYGDAMADEEDEPPCSLGAVAAWLAVLLAATALWWVGERLGWGKRGGYDG